MRIENCRLCRGKLSGPKLNLGKTPLANEFLKTTEKQDMFPLEVCVCTSCGHYQLNESVDPERIFRHYVYVAGTSPVNVEHFRKYAEHMVEYCQLQPGSKVLDIASNDGLLLKLFKELGMKVLGIDPAINLAEEANRQGLPTIPEFFTEEQSLKMLKEYGTFDVITANNVFAHVPDLIDFAKGVKHLLSPNGVFTFEVSYFGDVCDKVLFDTIYHEHSSYHTITPLILFFKDRGMEVFDVERLPNHGGSVRVFVRHANMFPPFEEKVITYDGPPSWVSIADPRERHREASDQCIKNDWNQVCRSCGHGGCNSACQLYDFRPYKTFDRAAKRVDMYKWGESNMNEKVDTLQKNIKKLGLELRDKLYEAKEQGKSIVIYGTPAKATTLMYALRINEKLIDFAVEDNPLKQGCYTPGKHVLICATEKIFEAKPDVILVLAWNFAPSIIEKVEKMWYKKFGNVRYPTFITPLPELKVQRYCEGKTCTCGEGPWEKFNTMKNTCDKDVGVYKCQACGGLDYAYE